MENLYLFLYPWKMIFHTVELYVRKSTSGIYQIKVTNHRQGCCLFHLNFRRKWKENNGQTMALSNKQIHEHCLPLGFWWFWWFEEGCHSKTPGIFLSNFPTKTQNKTPNLHVNRGKWKLKIKLKFKEKTRHKDSRWKKLTSRATRLNKHIHQSCIHDE